ncbi:MAG: 30S ribosomal protein S18 [Candidatus Tyloplasma litorale]|nr:MAG: 30S ribosomal protein S18 [Mycoplasmatales bacterium]
MPRTAKGRKTPPKKVFKTNRKCLFTYQNIEYIDYKDVEVLKKFISPINGKIKPRRITGTSAKYQRKLSKAIKQAREVGFLPFVADN